MLFDAQFGYDPAGNRLWLKDNVRTGRDELYEYDNLNRLRGFERGALNAEFTAIATPLEHEFVPAGQSWSGLDRRGNWLDSAVTVGSPAATVDEHRTVNGVNEYLTATIGASSPQTLTHDNNGNLTHNPTARNIDDAPGVDTASGQRYVYDEENRLTEVHRLSNDEFLLENKYDALGRRIESVDYLDESSQGETVCGAGGKGGIGVSPVVTRYIYAGLETLEEHVSCDAGLTWTLAREYLWGDRFPEPLAMIDHTDLGDVPATGQPNGGEEVLHYLHDALGSVVALTNAAGAEVERYTYAPYGPTYIEDPTTGDRRAASSYGNPWMWTAQRYDAGVNLYHFTFRAYSPRLGRWLQRDPLGYVDGVSLYEHVASMPTTLTDPLGLFSASPPMPGVPGEDDGGKPKDPGAEKRKACDRLRDALDDIQQEAAEALDRARMWNKRAAYAKNAHDALDRHKRFLENAVDKLWNNLNFGLNMSVLGLAISAAGLGVDHAASIPGGLNKSTWLKRVNKLWKKLPGVGNLNKAKLAAGGRLAGWVGIGIALADIGAQLGTAAAKPTILATINQFNAELFDLQFEQQAWLSARAAALANAQHELNNAAALVAQADAIVAVLAQYCGDDNNNDNDDNCPN